MRTTGSDTPNAIKPDKTSPYSSGKPKKAEGPIKILVAAVSPNDPNIKGLLSQCFGIRRQSRLVTNEVAIIANK